MNDGERALFRAALVDRYALGDELGSGGMAVVFAAHDRRHDRDVALKVFRADLSASMGAERFQREIRFAAQLNHPHIVPLFDSGEAAGLLYYAMPLVRGETLRHRIDREGPLPVADALRIATGVCGALAYAHERGVVHRDIKPENILLHEGHAVVADFGIARALDRVGGDALTGLGMALGTPAYMSPEQALGEATVDGRSDQYSLACVVFEMLTGTQPFPGPTAAAVIAHHITQPPPALAPARPDVGSHVAEAITRALAKDPDARHAGTRAFAAALDAAPSSPTPVPPADTSRVVCVLTFRDLSHHAATEWLATGIAESVAADLKRVQGLRLVRHEGVRQALARRGSPVETGDDALEVARLLGARWCVWGSYQSVGERLRITAQVVDVEAADIGPPCKLDGTLDDLFTLQDRLVAEALGIMAVSPTDAEQARLARVETATLSAYELHARARQQWYLQTPEAMDQAGRLFEEAAARDPSYALSHAGLGSVHAFRFITSSDPHDLQLATAHLTRALDLDPDLGEAHTWLGYVYLRSNRLTEALTETTRAAELEPEFHFAHYFRGAVLVAMAEQSGTWQHMVDASVAVARACACEPGAQFSWQVLATLLLGNGQYADALRPLGIARAIEDGLGVASVRFIGARVLQALCLLRSGDLAAAEHGLLAAIPVYDASQMPYATLFRVMALLGLADVARRQGRDDDALVRARQADALCIANPRHLGVGYARVRVHCALARAAHALGMPAEARKERRAAEQLLVEKSGYTFSWGSESNEGSACHDLALTWAHANKVDECLHWLGRAIDACWNDHPQLRSDPAFRPLQGVPAFEAAVARCTARSLIPTPSFT